MIYGSEPNETDLANHDDDWFDHTDSPAILAACR